jgi:hypothetical protein
MILKNEAENFIKDILEKLLCTNINFKLIYFFFSVDFFEGRDQMNQQRLRNLWYTILTYLHVYHNQLVIQMKMATFAEGLWYLMPLSTIFQ